MSFLYPNFIYFILPIMIILFGFLITQKESQKLFFSEEVMDKLQVNANSLSLKTRNILYFFVGLLMVLSLTQPVIKQGTVEIKAKSADIMIALDISDSMLAGDVYPNRLDLAKQKALDFFKEIPNERVGVVAFAKNSYLVSPLSFDTAAVSFLLSQLETSSITQKGTDFLSMLEVIGKSKTKTDKKYVLILSDGGDKDDFSKEISLAKEKGVVVFILGIGTSKGAPIKLKEGDFIKQNGVILISKLNENISDLATKTGGVYIQNTTSNRDVMAMLSEIQSVSDKKELKSQEIQKYIPLFYYPLGLSLFILLMAISSMPKLFRSKIPHAIVFLSVLFINPHAKAGLLDFMDLKEAKEAYNGGDYEKSASGYEKYGSNNDNSQSNYNAANSYYKQKQYDKALELYKKSSFEDDTQRANNFSNMGNAYVKSGQEDSLQKAKEVYEKSLEIKEDKNTRENLEAVEKEIEKQKKEEEKKDDKKDENKDQENKDKENKDSKDDKEKNEDKKDSKKNKDSDEKKEEEKKEDKSKDSEEDKDKDKKNKEKSKEEKKQDEPKELEENKNESKAESKQEMSDEEEEKWIQQLNDRQKTYLYKLSEDKQNEENTNEKPW